LYYEFGPVSISILSYINKWTHFAIVCDNGTNHIYVDGVEFGSYTLEIDIDSFSIGNSEPGPFPGKISNFRVSNIARYEANFTPMLPLTADDDTILLLTDSFTNDVPGATVETIGNPTIASEVISYIPYLPSYGVISGFSNGNYLTVPTSDLGMSEDFTIECFAFIPDTESNLGIFVTGFVGIGVYGGFIFQNDVSVSKTNYVNKWTHIAIVSVSGTQYVYVDGEQFGSYSHTIGSTLYIGADNDSNFTNGKISNFRVSDVARYTQNFTPELPLIEDGDTTLLITDSLSSVTKVGDNVTIASELISYTPFQA
jgi:hypothetical protein